MKRFPLFFVCLIFCGTALANSAHTAYSLILAVISYSKWSNVSQPTLCVIDNSVATLAFQNQTKASAYNFHIVSVTSANFSKTQCQAVYFSGFSAQQQQNFINNYPQKNLLSFSDNNSDCEIGSTFCLYTRRGNMTFNVNLDALSRSGVHIDPRVLLLARNTE